MAITPCTVFLKTQWGNISIRQNARNIEVDLQTKDGQIQRIRSDRLKGMPPKELTRSEWLLFFKRTFSQISFDHSRGASIHFMPKCRGGMQSRLEKISNKIITFSSKISSTSHTTKQPNRAATNSHRIQGISNKIITLSSKISSTSHTTKQSNRAATNSHGIEKISANDIQYECLLGEGTIGIVYKGFCHKNPVAIKEIFYYLPKKSYKKMKAEIATIAQVNHPHIVMCYGMCKNPKSLITELMPQSLYQFLHVSNVHCPWELRYRMMKDIARGLYHLHENKVVHRNLKSANIFLDRNLSAKITDFSLTRIYSAPHNHASHTNWMAPELASKPAKYSKKSDIFNYGIVLWEIAARREPFQNIHSHLLMGKIQKGTREDCSADWPPAFVQLIENCWHQNPEERPSLVEIQMRLTQISEEQASGIHKGKENAEDETKKIFEEKLTSLGENIKESVGIAEFSHMHLQHSESIVKNLQNQMMQLEGAFKQLGSTFLTPKESIQTLQNILNQSKSNIEMLTAISHEIEEKIETLQDNALAIDKKCRKIQKLHAIIPPQYFS